MKRTKIKASNLESVMHGVVLRANLNLHLEQKITCDLYKIMYAEFASVFEIIEDYHQEEAQPISDSLEPEERDWFWQTGC